MSSVHYDVCGAVCVTIAGGRFIAPEVTDPLFAFRVSQPPRAPDIVVNVGRFRPCLADTVLVSHRLYVGRGYVYDPGYKGVRCEIHGLDGPTSIRRINVELLGGVKSRMFGLAGIVNDLIRPLIDDILMDRGLLSLHGAGLCKDGSALLLLGRGGCHKTSVAMDLVRRRGWMFFGDDRILVDVDGRLRPFVTSPGLFDYRCAVCQNEDLGRWSRLRYLRWRRHRSCDQVRPQGFAEVKLVCSVERGTGGAFAVAPSRAGRMARRAVISEEAELWGGARVLGLGGTGRFAEYRDAYIYVHPHSRIASRWDRLEAMARRAFRGLRCLEVVLPACYSVAIADRLAALVGSMGAEL